MPRTYLFYDLETSGLSKAFDQVVQFAAIRTDEALQPIQEHNIIVQLSADTVPSPEAVLTHRLTPAQCAKGVSEWDAVKQIHTLMNTPGTWSVGYNTLGFDDEFLRFSFYRHLLPPYTHQYVQDCGRFDLYPLAALYANYCPDILNWPSAPTAAGLCSLKLENLNAVNHWVGGMAHDALVDVRATLALAQVLQQQTDVWQYALGYFNKTIDQQRFAALSDGLVLDAVTLPKAILLAGSLGAEAQFQAPVLGIGGHKIYRNQMLWLRLDHLNFADLSVDELQERAWVVAKKWGEPPLCLPPYARYWQRIDTTRQRQVADNIAWCQAHPDLILVLRTHWRTREYPVVEHLDIDAALYAQPFLSNEEAAWCARFNHVAPLEKIQLYERTAHEGLRQQMMRLLGRHCPDVLPTALASAFQAHLVQVRGEGETRKCLDYRGQPRLTIQQARQKTQALLTDPTLTPADRALLDDLVRHWA